MMISINPNGSATLGAKWSINTNKNDGNSLIETRIISNNIPMIKNTIRPNVNKFLYSFDMIVWNINFIINFSNCLSKA